MDFFKKGQGLSMSVIIVAAIALLVLVIISVLVLRSGGKVSDAYACEENQNTYCTQNPCGPGEADCEPCGGDPQSFKDCPQDDQVCCVAQ